MTHEQRLRKLEQQLARLRSQPRRNRWPMPPEAVALLERFYARHPRFASMTREQRLADDQLREDVCTTTAALLTTEGMADFLARGGDCK